MDHEEDWWDDLISAERFAVHRVNGEVKILLHHDFDDSTIELQTIDDVLHRIRQALERGVIIRINLEKYI